MPDEVLLARCHHRATQFEATGSGVLSLFLGQGNPVGGALPRRRYGSKDMLNHLAKGCLRAVVCGFIAAAPLHSTYGAQSSLRSPHWLGEAGDLEVTGGAGATSKSVVSSCVLSFRVPGLVVSAVDRNGQTFTRLAIPNVPVSQETGRPELPVWRRILACDSNAVLSVRATVRAAREFKLPYYGLPDGVLRHQAPIPKVPGAIEQAMLAVESVPASAESPVARLVELGVQRGQRLLLLEVCPVSYDADSGSVVLRQAMDVEIVAAGSERAASLPFTSPPTGARETKGGENGISTRRLLIIAPPALAAGLGPFVAHKSALGWLVDSFTTDVTGSTVESIQTFIRLRYGSEATRPSHLLLVGDTDTIPAWPGKGAYLPDTDLYYACMDGPGDWLPDMAYGRFPARTTQQLTHMLSRSMSYETNVTKYSAFAARGVFVTSEDTYTLTEGTHNYVIGRHLDPRAYASQRLYRHTYSATASQITNAVNEGCGVLAYSGHGSGVSWLDPAVSVSSVQGLTNSFLCPLVMSFACDTGAYRSYDESFAEAWLRRGGNAGAVAVLASSQDTYWEEDDVFEKSMFAALLENGASMLGDAVEAAKGRYLAFYGPGSETLQYFEQYNFFGDPTLALVVPDGVSLTDSVRATRQLPQTCVNSNELITVTLEVVVTNPTPGGLTVKERLPTGWTVTNTCWQSSPMLPTLVSGEYRWSYGSGVPVSSGTLSYQTRSVGNTGQVFVITGSLGYGTNTVATGGDQEVDICPIVDMDHDGIPDHWEIQYGLNPTNAADAGQDWDGDGMVNWQEYQADTNPTNKASVLRLIDVSIGARGTAPRWIGGVQSTQFLERRDSLSSGGLWLCIRTNLPPTALTNSFEDTLQRTNAFYRIRVAR